MSVKDISRDTPKTVDRQSLFSQQENQKPAKVEKVILNVVDNSKPKDLRAQYRPNLQLELEQGPLVPKTTTARKAKSMAPILAEVEARVKSFREKKPTWVPEVNRVEKKKTSNITQPEYYANGKRMNPVKLMYNIKQKIDRQIEESNGNKQKDDSGEAEGVENNRNYFRFKDSYLIQPRGYIEPLPQIPEGREYSRNVELIGKMLNHHSEFQEAMNRKIRIVSNGEKITQAAMNPVMIEKVADVIRQLDEANSPSNDFKTNQRQIKQYQIERWVQKHQRKGEGSKTVEHMHEADIADEIFKVWDKKLLRYIPFDDFAKNLISLGLAPDQLIVRKIMIALKGENSNFPDQVYLKEFRRIFEMNRFGHKANEIIE